MLAELKPYPEYKPSHEWIGPAPSHWQVVPGFAAFREKQVKNTGMAVSDVLSLSYGRIVVKPPEKLHGLVPASFETYQIVEPGDIIIRPTDLQNDWHSIRVGLAKNRGIITSAYMCLKPTALYTPEYLHSLLLSYDMLKFFYGMGSGLRQSLDHKDLKRFPMLVPPPAEQAGIVRFLGAVDRKVNRFIRAKRRLIEVLTEQKQAIITHAVTKGLNPHAPLKPSGIDWLGDVPEHWSFTRLKNVANVHTGITLGKNYGSVPTRSYPYLRVANVQVGRVDLRTVKEVAVPESEARGSMLQAGDVLMTEGGDIDKLGRGCVWNAEVPNCIHQNHIFAVRCRAAILPEYLVGLMGSKHGRAYFQLTAKQTTNLASTNSSTLRAFPFFLPPVAEQHAILTGIVESTATIEHAISDAQREIDLIREYRTRLVADVVTGKVDVRAAAASLPEETDSEEQADRENSFSEPDLEGGGTDDAQPADAEEIEA